MWLPMGLLGFVSCGVYSFKSSGKSTIGTIAIESFEDRTGQYGLADLLYQSVNDAFIADGNIRVVSADVAEAILMTSLTRYERRVQEYDANDRVSQYKVVINFDLTLRNTADGSDYWTLNVALDGLYNADEETEEDGQREVGVKLVETVINKTTKSW
jgi:hypothetical protein